MTQALHRHLAKHTQRPMEAAAHLKLEGVRRAAALMVHRKHLLLTHTEKLTNPTTREHMQRLIHYHAVHDPDATDPLRTPHMPPISIRRPQRHHQSTPEHTSHPRSHPAPPSPTKPNQGHPYVNVDGQDPSNPPSPAPQDPEQPPLTPTTIRDADLLRATLQGRALSTPLGWYRLQEDGTKLTVKALWDLTAPGKGLHEAIVDLVLWRARHHTQGQHVLIPPIESGQALTHDTDTNVTRRGTMRLRRAPAEKDHPADPNHPKQLEQATTPTRDTALRAAGLCTADDDLPAPSTDSDHPPPEVWCTVLECGHYYVVAARATSPSPQ